MYKGDEMIILCPIEKTNSNLFLRQQKLSKKKLMRVHFFIHLFTPLFQTPSAMTTFLCFFLYYFSGTRS